MEEPFHKKKETLTKMERTLGTVNQGPRTKQTVTTKQGPDRKKEKQEVPNF